MSALRDVITEYGLEAAISTGVVAVLKWLRPRRFTTFIAAVKEREDMLAASQYWQSEADRRERLLDECRTEQTRLDQEIAHLRARLRDGGTA